jgi:ABC-2 type transport system permease protein
MFGQTQPPLSSWNQLREALRQEYEVRDVDLSRGQVPADVNVLVVVAPQGLSDKERFTIDQYLMRGGAVIVAAGNFSISVDQLSGGLALKPLEGNLQDMLAHYGVQVEQALVLDPQNEPFPQPRTRDVGGFQVQEVEAIDYPFFIDVRSDGMASGHPIVSNLPAVTLNWTSPITLDVAEGAERETTVLLRSSPASWIQGDINIQPDFEAYPEFGFPVGQEQRAYPLAVSSQGVFESYFRDKPSPFEAGGDEAEEETEALPGAEEERVPPEAVPATVETSSGNARLVVVGSTEFINDVVFGISARLSADRYRNSLQLIQNAVAWSTEDADLLEIRTRGTAARVLRPLSEGEQSFWEVVNYAAVMVSLLAIGIVSNARLKNEEPMALQPPQAVSEVPGKGV